MQSPFHIDKYAAGESGEDVDGIKLTLA